MRVFTVSILAILGFALSGCISESQYVALQDHSSRQQAIINKQQKIIDSLKNKLKQKEETLQRQKALREKIAKKRRERQKRELALARKRNLAASKKKRATSSKIYKKSTKKKIAIPIPHLFFIVNLF